jgi:ribosomal protein L33
MIRSDFFQDKKYCPRCRDYVRYLQSLDSSFCVECGAKVRLFSSADKRAFLKSLKNSRKPRQTGQKKRVS